MVVNDTSVESGRVFIRRDDKMLIELTQPDPRTILRTGDDLFVYNPRLKRVEQYNIGKHRADVEQFLLLGFGSGGGDLKKGRRLANNVQAAEKVYLSFRLEAKSPGGHSSLPTTAAPSMLIAPASSSRMRRYSGAASCIRVV